MSGKEAPTTSTSNDRVVTALQARCQNAEHKVEELEKRLDDALTMVADLKYRLMLSQGDKPDEEDIDSKCPSIRDN